MGDDEPLDAWAARRATRLRPVGERKAVHLGGDPHRAAHIAPDTPRLIVEWDGYAWQPGDHGRQLCRRLPHPQPRPGTTEGRDDAAPAVTDGTGNRPPPQTVTRCRFCRTLAEQRQASL
ncbi:DUF6087 family protein [Streptomyces violascens]